MAKVNGYAAGALGVGILIFWSGFTGKGILANAQSVIQGKSPQANPSVNTPQDVTAAQDPSAGIVGSVSTIGGIPAASTGQAAIQQAATARGWGPGTPDWQPLVDLENREAGFNPQAKNPSSGAYGLAQALGHGSSGTAGSVTNEYGGFGLTDAQSRAANSGQAGPQAVWMMNYIAATYGNPRNAEAHETSNGWY